MRRVVVGPYAQCDAILSCSLIHRPLSLKGEAQVVMRLGEIRPDLQGGTEFGDSLVDRLLIRRRIPLVHQGEADGIVCLCEIGIQTESSTILCYRPIERLLACQD